MRLPTPPSRNYKKEKTRKKATSPSKTLDNLPTASNCPVQKWFPRPDIQLLSSGMISHLEQQEGLGSGVRTLHQRYAWALTSRGTRQESPLLNELQRRTKTKLFSKKPDLTGLVCDRDSSITGRSEHRGEGDSCCLNGSDIKTKSENLRECSNRFMLSAQFQAVR